MLKKISDDIFAEITREKQNIVLIGMPGSGKSTIGKALAKKLSGYFLDIKGNQQYKSRSLTVRATIQMLHF